MDLFGTPQHYVLNHGHELADPDPDRVVPPHRRPGERGFTYIDALSHIFWVRKMYNGYPSEWVTRSPVRVGVGR